MWLRCFKRKKRQYNFLKRSLWKGLINFPLEIHVSAIENSNSFMLLLLNEVRLLGTVPITITFWFWPHTWQYWSEPIRPQSWFGLVLLMNTEIHIGNVELGGTELWVTLMIARSAVRLRLSNYARWPGGGSGGWRDGVTLRFARYRHVPATSGTTRPWLLASDSSN